MRNKENFGCFFALIGLSMREGFKVGSIIRVRLGFSSGRKWKHYSRKKLDNKVGIFFLFVCLFNFLKDVEFSQKRIQFRNLQKIKTIWLDCIQPHHGTPPLAFQSLFMLLMAMRSALKQTNG